VCDLKRRCVVELEDRVPLLVEARLVCNGFQATVRSKAEDDLDARAAKAEASVMASLCTCTSKDLVAVRAGQTEGR